MLKVVHSNVVITAEQFNPSIVSQLWLVRKGIVQETDFLAGCVFSSEVANVITPSFQLVVIPSQLQFMPKDTSEKSVALIREKIKAFVEALPETPYSAIGLNFIVHLQRDDITTQDLEKRLFYAPGMALADEFQTGDAHLGAYMSKDMLNGRLRLDVRPVTLQWPKEDEPSNKLQFNFNYHRALSSENPVPQILEQLDSYSAALNYVSFLTDKVMR
jgi:hypothetical protein